MDPGKLGSLINLIAWPFSSNRSTSILITDTLGYCYSAVHSPEHDKEFPTSFRWYQYSVHMKRRCESEACVAVLIPLSPPIIIFMTAHAVSEYRKFP